MRLFTVAALVVLFLGTMSGQTLRITASSVTAASGDSVTVTLNAENFNNVSALTLYLRIDTTVLKFSRGLNWNAAFGSSFGVGKVGTQIVLAWDNVTPVNIGTGKLTDLRFYYVGGSSGLNFNALSCEITDPNGDIIPALYVNGTVSGAVTAPPAPQLHTPGNGAAGVARPVNFKWYKSTGAVSYQLQVAADNSFINIAYSDSVISDSTLTINGLNENTTYYWRVRGKNTAGYGSYSTGFVFYTYSAPAAPQLALPANNAVSVQRPVLFKWSRQVTALLYQLQVASDAGFSTLLFSDSTLTDTAVSVGVLNAGASCYWRVRAKNLLGYGSFSSAWMFSTEAPATGLQLSISSQTAAPGDSVTVSINALNFNNVAALTLYIQIDTTVLKFNRGLNWNAAFGGSFGVGKVGSQIVLAWDNVTPVNIGNGKITDLRFFYTGSLATLSFNSGICEIADANGDLIPAAYAGGTITPLAPPAAPKLYLPANNASAVQRPVLFKWNKAAEAVFYQVQVAQDSLFQNVIYADTTITDSLVTVASLQPDQSYYWRVRGKNTYGYGPFSPANTFAVYGELKVNVRLLIEGFYETAAAWGPHRKDTVRVYLHRTALPFEVVDSSISVIDSLGSLAAAFTHAVSSTYYLRVFHRNSITVWSSPDGSFFTRNGSNNYDFTTDSLKAFGGILKYKSGMWCLYSGDVNKDRLVDLNDMLLCDNASVTGGNGYEPSDVNADTHVDLADMLIIDNNNTVFAAGIAPDRIMPGLKGKTPNDGFMLNAFSPPPAYEISIENLNRLSSSRLQFDIFIGNTGSDGIEFSGFQFGIKPIVPLGKPAQYGLKIVPGYSQLPNARQPLHFLYDEVKDVFRIPPRAVSGPGTGFFIYPNGKKTRIGRFEINSENLPAGLAWSFSYETGGYPCMVAAYVNGINTDVTGGCVFVDNGIVLPPQLPAVDDKTQFSIAAYPNPFNAESRITYTIKTAGEVQLMLYNSLMQQVAVLQAPIQLQPGKYSVVLNGSTLPTGIYFCSLKTGTNVKMMKIVLLK